jgi:Tol biopolymer transport system component
VRRVASGHDLSPVVCVGRVRAAGWLGCLLVLLVALRLLALVPSAYAIYGPVGGGFGANIVSIDNASDEQANAPTTDADVSANGQYVVFQTKATNFFENDGVPGGDPEPEGACREGGIFRYDLLTGELALVADGTEVQRNSDGECEPSHVIFTGAENPSISENGRYVVFSTAQQLVPQVNEHNENIEVYERDMDVPLTAQRPSSGAYTLVSAQNGGESPPVYENSLVPTPIPGGDPGSEVWPNTAISANGQYVLFRSAELPSSLPEGSSPTTPADQLFVRNVQAKTTTLVTVKSEGGAPAGGANGPASISADGSTVAWLGSHAPSQTVFLPGEDLDESLPYYLWRRWSEPDVSTRRITGIADPEDPECKPGEGVTQNPTTLGPCYGPLTYPEASLTGLSGVTPSLSADGYTVAFLAGSSIRPDILKADALDIFLTSMKPGVTRKAGTSELTLAVDGAQGDGNASVTSLALSADGTHIAFVSQRNAFVLPEPAPVGSFSQNALESELYMIDLSTDTLERAVTGLEGAELNGSVLANPTLSANGEIVAFASSASNLIYGDANQASDAFAATHELPAGTAAIPAGFNSVQGGFSLTGVASPELGLSVKRAADGELILLVETPGAGRLVAQAQGTISTKLGKRTRKRKVVLARASGATQAEGTATLVLRLSSMYAKDLKSAGKLKALVAVSYTPAPPAEALSAEASATFVSTSTKKSAKGRSKAPGKAKK